MGVPFHNSTIAQLPPRQAKLPNLKPNIKMPLLSSEKPSDASNPSGIVADHEISPLATSPALTSSSTGHVKTEAEEAADRLYEERIEEEYAKREGGA